MMPSPTGDWHWVSADSHARQLLHWVRVEGGVVGEILASDLQSRYGEMLIHYEWHERPWNVVGKHFRMLIRDKRRYKWVEREGRRHRLRVYTIPAPTTVEPPVEPALEPALELATDGIGTPFLH